MLTGNVMSGDGDACRHAELSDTYTSASCYIYVNDQAELADINSFHNAQ